MAVTTQEIGLDDYMNQLNSEHTDYLKDYKEKNKYKEKLSEADLNRLTMEQNQKFEELQRGTKRGF